MERLLLERLAETLDERAQEATGNCVAGMGMDSYLLSKAIKRAVYEEVAAAIRECLNPVDGTFRL